MARVPRYSGGGLEDRGGPSDGFPEKLAKYVPAEVLAFYVPALALSGVRTDSAALLVVTAAGLAGTIVYLVAAARQQVEASRQPPTWFYVLAGIAFLGWAVGTVPELGKLTGLSEGLISLILPVTVFLVPGIDQALTRRP